MNKPKGLGRGLDALLPPGPKSRPAPLPVESADGNVIQCALEKLVPNRAQPRRRFDEQGLEELAQSLREHGLIEPLIARRLNGEDRYEIIAGERRWRAAQRAGLREVLVVVRELADKPAYEIALIENVQREDLNAIDFAAALRVLIDEYGHTQETLATAVGKDRTTITNALRLLKLPERVQGWVTAGSLSEGHARALLGAPDAASMTRLAERAIAKKLSVRQTEAEVRALKRDPKEKPSGSKSPNVRDLEQRLTRSLGTRCEVRDKGGKGELVIRYANPDDLDRVLERLL